MKIKLGTVYSLCTTTVTATFCSAFQCCGNSEKNNGTIMVSFIYEPLVFKVGGGMLTFLSYYAPHMPLRQA